MVVDPALTVACEYGVCVCVGACVHVCTHVRVHVHVYVNVCIGAWVCMCVCLHSPCVICMYMHACRNQCGYVYLSDDSHGREVHCSPLYELWHSMVDMCITLHWPPMVERYIALHCICDGMKFKLDFLCIFHVN